MAARLSVVIDEQSWQEDLQGYFYGAPPSPDPVATNQGLESYDGMSVAGVGGL